MDPRSARPATLYRPGFEHDNCGVGLVCRLDDEPTHAVVHDGLRLLNRLAHRGGVGADAASGDGAGVLTKLPHRFLADAAGAEGIVLPRAGQYGLGMLFLASEVTDRAAEQQRFEQAAEASGFRVLGWRLVPTYPEQIGETARAGMPSVWQVFVERASSSFSATGQLERALYLLRRRAERAGLTVASLSAQTLVYKGMLRPDQLAAFYPDLNNPLFESSVAIVHARFSTNTLPRWPLAQPFRRLCQNGEINTVAGNRVWTRARAALLDGPHADLLRPVLDEAGSDSQSLDEAMELLWFLGRPLHHAARMMIPAAWEHDSGLQDEQRAFYRYHAGLMEPWDGPASVLFTDGRYVGAILDRNGLRPTRYTLTEGGVLVVSSETGTLPHLDQRATEKGRLRPGDMLLVDLDEHRIVPESEWMVELCRQHPYEQWIDEHQLSLDDLPDQTPAPGLTEHERITQQRRHGYTEEELKLLIRPMAEKGKEAVGSMGNDTPLAVLSDRARPLFDYFKQRFAQVTNPPLDAIREQAMTSLYTWLGPAGCVDEVTPQQARRLFLESPVLSRRGFAQVLASPFLVQTLDATFRVNESLESALERLVQSGVACVKAGAELLVVSDRAAGPDRMACASLLAGAALHHALLRAGLRHRCSLIVEVGDAREVHHLATLIGYGCDAVHPYLALETAAALGVTYGFSDAEANYLKASDAGLLKVMSKLGIATIQSYRGAQLFEAVGIAEAVIERYFTGTVSRLGGIGLDVIEQETRLRHERAHAHTGAVGTPKLDAGGMYHWRQGEERHLLDPMTIARLQHAVRKGDETTYQQFADRVNGHSRASGALRGLLDLVEASEPVPVEEVEPWTSIVQRFKTGAMSYGSISGEAHETLAVAMNRMGGKSNTGEGGEAPERYATSSLSRSRIKQVASGRFGVTIGYLASADEIQIKMAQGAKPGEGGQLPGEKVLPWIAKTRHSTPGVGLISPPPHHDIYSIEDLAQLIFDLKNANPTAAVSVKLVAEAGVGTVAAGVAKAGADLILISGYDGGTGASARTSIMHAGLPWELGLSETHQTLVLNGLRERVQIECDGKLKTGRDVVLAALLGADEFGFATAPLIAMGCIMMRKCHLNTCPVGIATQDPRLRAKFNGQPEHVINYFHFVAEEVRQIMARLGVRTVEDLVGRVDKLGVREDITHPKARHLDLNPLIAAVSTPESLSRRTQPAPGSRLSDTLDHQMIRQAGPALERGEPVRLHVETTNMDRALGTMLSYEVVTRRNAAGRPLPGGTIRVHASGIVGQSAGAFLAQGIDLRITGDANDYLGKGLSGGQIVVKQPEDAGFVANMNVIAGNVALYGATAGRLFVRGRAGERFAVRNSGASAVVEGVGDHGCEYMTGGRVVVLGPTGRNFAAGMSGGVAYVMDGTYEFRNGRCNRETVGLYQVTDAADASELHHLLVRHAALTGSEVAQWVLDHWHDALGHFVKVFPHEYRNVLRTSTSARTRRPSPNGFPPSVPPPRPRRAV